MGARRSRRSSDLGGYDAGSVDVVRQATPEKQSNNSSVTPRRPFQLERKPTKPARSGVRDGAGRRRSSKQALVDAKNEAGDGSILVVGEKATKLPREAGAGRDPSRRDVSNGYMLRYGPLTFCYQPKYGLPTVHPSRNRVALRENQWRTYSRGVVHSMQLPTYHAR